MCVLLGLSISGKYKVVSETYVGTIELLAVVDKLTSESRDTDCATIFRPGKIITSKRFLGEAGYRLLPRNPSSTAYSWTHGGVGVHQLCYEAPKFRSPRPLA